MNAHYDDSVFRKDLKANFEEALRESLIAYCRLSTDDVERIDESMRTSDMNFSQAALHVGLVTENELEAAGAWARATLADRDVGVVEQALHRQNGGTRQLTAERAGIGTLSARLALACDSEHIEGESIRALRAELLLFAERDRRAGCFAVVSPCSGDGRSHLAAELAISFSQLGRRTLLVDADLRNPNQHRLFNVEPKWGLAQALAFWQTSQLFGVQGLPYLSLVPAVPSAPNAAETLTGNRFKQLMRTWRYGYDFIVIDTPALGRYPDALNIASRCENVVLAARGQSTSFREMKTALQRLGNARCNVLGAVIGNY
jgi:receptor protein-tyrosine kinase